MAVTPLAVLMKGLVPESVRVLPVIVYPVVLKVRLCAWIAPVRVTVPAVPWKIASSPFAQLALAPLTERFQLPAVFQVPVPPSVVVLPGVAPSQYFVAARPGDLARRMPAARSAARERDYRKIGFTDGGRGRLGAVAG